MKTHEKYITEVGTGGGRPGGDGKYERTSPAMISRGKGNLKAIVEKFKNMIKDDYGKPLSSSEVNYIKKEIDRLAKDYKGM